jgi:hypothetical protein
VSTWQVLSDDPGGWPDLPPVGVAVPDSAVTVLDERACPAQPTASDQRLRGRPDHRKDGTMQFL